MFGVELGLTGVADEGHGTEYVSQSDSLDSVLGHPYHKHKEMPLAHFIPVHSVTHSFAHSFI